MHCFCAVLRLSFQVLVHPCSLVSNTTAAAIPFNGQLTDTARVWYCAQSGPLDLACRACPSASTIPSPGSKQFTCKSTSVGTISFVIAVSLSGEFVNPHQIIRSQKHILSRVAHLQELCSLYYKSIRINLRFAIHCSRLGLGPSPRRAWSYYWILVLALEWRPDQPFFRTSILLGANLPLQQFLNLYLTEEKLMMINPSPLNGTSFHDDSRSPLLVLLIFIFDFVNRPFLKTKIYLPLGGIITHAEGATVVAESADIILPLVFLAHSRELWLGSILTLQRDWLSKAWGWWVRQPDWRR